jgi:TorA maturation chaperone TorD
VEIEQLLLDQVTFIGNVLGPLYLIDPKQGDNERGAAPYSDDLKQNVGERDASVLLVDPRLSGEKKDAALTPSNPSLHAGVTVVPSHLSPWEELNVAEAASQWPFVPAGLAQNCLMAMQDGLRGGLDSLVWEYRRLFAIGASPKPAPPWGSYYTDPEGAIVSQQTLRLRAWMRQNGIALAANAVTSAEVAAVEDHIGQMLLLMAWIAAQKPNLLQQFLSQHFLAWASRLLSALATATDHPFYNGMARLTNASLQGIQTTLAISPSPTRFYR